MGRVNAPFVNFNGGEIGQEVIGRVNLEGYAACAAVLENWMPEAEGPMSKRPGFMFRSQPVADDPFVLLHPFIYSVNQKALLCFSDNELRIASDGLIVSRAAVTSTVPNPGFATDTTNLIISTPTLSQAAAAGAAANLIDGDYATGYTSGATATQTISNDLGSVKTFDTLTLAGPLATLGKAPGNFTLIGSNDSGYASPTTILTVTGAAAWAIAERRSFAFAAVAFRYVRLSITTAQDATTGGYLLNEMAVHNATWGDVSAGSGSTAVTNPTTGMSLSAGQGGRAAMRVPVVTSSSGQPHALNIEVTRGPVGVRVGSAAGGSDLAAFTAATGEHSIEFTPMSANYFIELFSTDSQVTRIVSSVAISGAGDLVLDTPWGTDILRSLRFVQSGDVVYVSSGVGHRKRIERRGGGSWSLVDTDERDGPFLDPNLDDSFSLTPSATSGNITLTSSAALFAAGHEGALFQLTHSGQTVAAAISGVGQVTNSIRVTGIDDDRKFTIARTGTWVGTLVLQRSVGNDTSFADTATTYTTSASVVFDDTFDNQIIYYRLRASAWTSGTAAVTLTYSGGTTIGVVRVTDYVSPTQVSAEVLSQLGALTSTAEWAEGAWSDVRYWPKDGKLFDGRMWSIAEDQLWASRSNSFENHELTDLDNSAIARAIATGDVNPGMWLLPLARLLIGTEGAEVAIRESTQDGLVTAVNMTLRDIGTSGSADVSPVRIDTQGVAVDRSGIRAMLLGYSVEAQDYTTQSLMRLHRNIGRPGLLQLAVSRHPETRLWMVRSDGQLLTKAFTPGEAVLGWSRIITDGIVESVAVLPGDDGEDEVYVMVARTVGVATVRYLELMGSFYYEDVADACRVDSAITYSGVGVTQAVVPHLIGKTVRVWADGAVLAERVVPGSGIITFGKTVTKYSIGLGYSARYKSPRLAFGSQAGTAVGQVGKSNGVIIDLLESSPSLEYGDSFNKMDKLADRDLTGTYDAGSGMRTGLTQALTVAQERGMIKRDPAFCLRSDDPAPSRLRCFVLAHQLNERTGGG